MYKEEEEEENKYMYLSFFQNRPSKHKLKCSGQVCSGFKTIVKSKWLFVCARKEKE